MAKNKKLTEYWKEQVNEYKRSEVKITQSEWCKENNISLRRFNYWYCKFKENDNGDNVTGANFEKNSKDTKANDSNSSRKDNSSSNTNCSVKHADVNKTPNWIPLKIEDTTEDKNVSEYENENKTNIGIIINIGKAKIEIMKGFDNQSLLEVLKVVNLLC